jgi:hypothetical protein
VLSLRDCLLRSTTDSHDQQIKPRYRIYFGELREIIVIFKGVKFSYILRRKEEGKPLHWTLIGFAYVHGIMYGELFEKSSVPDGLQLDEFLLEG